MSVPDMPVRVIVEPPAVRVPAMVVFWALTVPEVGAVKPALPSMSKLRPTTWASLPAPVKVELSSIWKSPVP